MKLSPEYFKRCMQFANDIIDTNYSFYKTREQNNRDRILFQIAYGKLAEWIAYIHIVSHGVWCTPPDMNVYDEDSKTYDADLVSEKYDIHVKSQTKESMEQYGASWMFQDNDPLIMRPSNRDYLFFIIIKTPQEANIVKHLNANKVLELYKDPVVDKLKSKRVLYLNDLMHI